MLVLNGVEAIYSDVILAVKGISLTVPSGKCVTLLGGNGAGKSTTLKTISNIIRTEDGRVTSGTITLDGHRIDNTDPATIVRSGVVHIMEGRRVLRHLTVEQNLIVGGHMLSSGAELRQRPAERLRTDPAAGCAAHPHRRLPVGRRAADAGDRPRADVGGRGW